MSARRGCEDDSAFAEVRMGIVLVVNCWAFGKSAVREMRHCGVMGDADLKVGAKSLSVVPLGLFSAHPVQHRWRLQSTCI